ncbi:MAG: DUF4339 domain-containing protein [Hyphomicrobiaceae bacterium]
MTSDTVQTIGWYIAREDGDNDGPLSDAEMRRLIGRGRVKPTDRVWRDGMEEWVEARRIPNFEEVRRTYMQDAERAARQELEKRERHENTWAAKRESERSAVPSRPKPIPRTVAETRQRAQPSRSGWDYSQPTKPAGEGANGKFGGIENIDLEKMFGETAAKIGKIPQGAIVFFVLGLVFMPLLPVFWFIAWRIWAKANAK